MDTVFIGAVIGWGAAGILAFFFMKLHEKYSRQKGVIRGMVKELKLAKERIEDLMRSNPATNPTGVLVDEAGRVRDGG